jgi:tRNA threonylcarbamoyladenosine biosynthesis protein TsaB
MARILLLETATEVCSAALSADGKVIALQEQSEDFRHSELLTVFISQLFRETGITSRQLDAVCVSMGPGSYTGLRIGISVAKGICYAAGIPLIAISTLCSMAGFVARNINEITGKEDFNGLLCPMIDARRMEIYTALFDQNGGQLTDITAQIIHKSSFSNELQNMQIIFFGNGAMKCREVIRNPNALFPDGIYASARFMSELAEDYYNKRHFEDVAYFEPFYLKDFIATIPKNKVFK